MPSSSITSGSEARRDCRAAEPSSASTRSSRVSARSSRRFSVGPWTWRRIRWMRRRCWVESLTIFSSIARVPEETSSAERPRRVGLGRRLRSRKALPPPATAAMPRLARNGVSRPAPPTRALTPRSMKLLIPSTPASTTGTPTVSQRPRLRGSETERERGAWTVPSRGAVPAAHDPGAGGAGARRPGCPPGPGREGVPPGRAGCRRGEGLWGLMGTADLSVDGAEAIDGESAGVRSRGDRARRPARTRTGRGPSSSTAPRLSRHREDPLGDVPRSSAGGPGGVRARAAAVDRAKRSGPRARSRP